MTPQEQNIAIAEACGWTIVQCGGLHLGNPHTWEDYFTPENQHANSLPSYTTDLNAMHSAVLTQSGEFQEQFACKMEDLINNRSCNFHELTALDWANCFVECLPSKRG